MNISVSTSYILKALIPYTKANLELAFKPGKFFSELSRLRGIQSASIKSAFDRQVQKGTIAIDNQGYARLTPKGKRQLQPFVASKLKNSSLMVIFDIPEKARWKRNHLRNLLRELQFEQIQKSVWVTSYNHKSLLQDAVRSLHLTNKQVKIYEVIEA